MRKMFPVAVLALALVACGQPGTGGTSGSPSTSTSSGSSLTGTAADVMAQVLTATAAALPANSAPITEQVALTADLAEGVGLTQAQFKDDVVSGEISRAMIMTFAHEVVLIQAKDAASAAKLKTAIAGAYNPGKWICVFPEQASIVESGAYVLLVVSTGQYAAAALDAFAKLAGTTGTVNTFYTGAK